jgi:DNA-binding XRE family transcriptional regulator
MAKKKIRVWEKKLTPEERAEAEQLAEQAESEFGMADARHARERSRHIRDIIKQLRDERKRQGLSLEQMAGQADISSQEILQIENYVNVNPTIVTVQRMARALGKSILIHLIELTEEDDVTLINQEDEISYPDRAGHENNE